MKVRKYLEGRSSGLIDDIIDSKSAAMEITKDSISLSKVPKNTTISIMIPHSDTSAFHAMVCYYLNYRKKTLIWLRKFMWSLIT
jgi:hypothetical protein